MSKKHIFLVAFALLLSLFFESCASPNSKFAVVHFDPAYKDIEANINKIIELSNEASKNGAKIVVFPELTTTGYSFYSRNEAIKYSDTIPGETTKKIGATALKNSIYIVLGFIERDVMTNLLYNTAVILGPSGKIIGKYRKHSHLVESSWCASGCGNIPVFHTEYGNIGLLICADICFSELIAQLVFSKAEILAIPTNGGINSSLLKSRAIEAYSYILLANRYGKEDYYYHPTLNSTFITESNLCIYPPFFYDFSGSESCIIDPTGMVKAKTSNACDTIVYTDIIEPKPLVKKIQRRPDLYNLIYQNTTNSYAKKCMMLPEPKFSHVAVNFINEKSIEEALRMLKKSLSKLKPKNLSLYVLQGSFLTVSHENENFLLEKLEEIAHSYNVDIVLGIKLQNKEKKTVEKKYLITNTKNSYSYTPVHKYCDENKETGSHFTVFDRPYGRISILSETDIKVPETILVLNKMCVDIIALPADDKKQSLPDICKAKSKEQIHILLSNSDGFCGIYKSGYSEYSNMFQEGKNLIFDEINTEDTRNKTLLNFRQQNTNLTLRD